MHYLVEQSYFPRNYDYQCITWNVFISEACKQYFCFPGCVLLFDANARSGEEWSSSFKMMRFEHLINFLCNFLSKMELLWA